MKESILAVALLLTLNSFSQNCNTVDKIISVQGGYPTNISIEAGIQGDFAGIFFGAKGTPTKIKGTGTLPASQGFNLNPYIKGQVKLLGEGEDQFYRIYLVGYGGLNRIYGAGIKIGFIVANDLMIYTEGMYTEQKAEGNIGVAFRF